jgi:hypothetical protein
MVLSCEEYRDQQQLLALKKRLSEDKLDPEEREEIERLVQDHMNPDDFKDEKTGRLFTRATGVLGVCSWSCAAAQIVCVQG